MQVGFPKRSALQLGLVLLVVAVVGLLGFAIPCPIHYLTGCQCPGCGTQRMFYHMVHGNWATAFECNRLLFLALPYLFLGVMLDFAPPRFPRAVWWRNALYGRVAYVVAIVAVAVFTYYRNR